MTRAVITSFHNYCSMYDHTYFNVISDYYLSNFNKYWRDEVDHLYLLDSNWDFPPIDDPKITVIKTDPNIRYYDAYKKVLPEIKEDLVGFLDDDMVVYQKGIIERCFNNLDTFYVTSIYDTIGEQHFEQLKGKSKFCPYFFFSRKVPLLRYVDCEWGPVMPKNETLGELTERMLADGLSCYEIEEDKTDFPTKNLGYYHVRAGSTVAYLLTTKQFGNPDTYWDYIKNQPSIELLRHCDWYDKMGGNSSEIREDIRKKQLVS